MKKSKIISAICFLSLLSACASSGPIYDPTHKIDSKKNVFYTFQQNGLYVDDAELMSKFRDAPSTHAQAGTAQVLYYGSLLPALVGGYIIGVGVAEAVRSDSNNDSGLDIAMGLGVVALAVGARFAANIILHDAVEVHNSEVVEVETPATKSKKRSDTGLRFNGTQVSYLF